MHIKRVLINDKLRMHPGLAQLYRERSTQLPATGVPSCPQTVDDIILHTGKKIPLAFREQLAKTVVEYHQKLDASPRSLENAALLEEKNTYAIVAGHQPSLFGGPLYLILKICSAVRTAEILNRQDSANRYIPVFWNGSEDHNTAEYLRTCFFDNNHDLKTLRIEDLPEHVAAEHLPAETLKSILQQIEQELPQSEFLPGLFEELCSTLKGTVGEAFSRLVLKWFGKSGLVVVEPHILRKLPPYAATLCSALEKNAQLRQAIATASEKISTAGFTPQLPPELENKTLVFHLAPDKRRCRILTSGIRFYTEEGTLDCEWGELLHKIFAEPENFSPVAALRPVIQSQLLPVVAYVAGGGELSYHFQLPEVFETLETTMPLLLPRPSATVLKSATIKYLARSRFEFEDILTQRFDFTHIQKQGEANFREVTRAFWDMLATIENGGRQLEYALSNAGIQSTADWKKEKERFYERLEGLGRRYMSQNPALGENASVSFNKNRKFLLPAEGYQDNSCWFIYFYCLFGDEFLDTICQNIDPLTNQHHILVPEFDD